jgi:hypothetical protein
MGKTPASETTDLDAAPKFMIRRIEDEANRSGIVKSAPKTVRKDR